MFKIGCHLSSSKGFLHMGKEAVKIGANTFQFFPRNPRGSKAKPLDLDDMKSFIEFSEENGITDILAHAPYTLNASSVTERVREFAVEIMNDDLDRLENIPGSLYNFHPGSHGAQDIKTGIHHVVNLLNDVITPQHSSTTILLETMSGKGSEIGGRFEELKSVIQGVNNNDNLGVCLDTCHVFDGGYDIVNDLEDVLSEFDKTIGLKRLKAIHLNDSMNEVGSHKDRHAKIGEGHIGLEAFDRIINHPTLRSLPFYLETPNDVSGYAKEIKLLKSLYKDN